MAQDGQQRELESKKVYTREEIVVYLTEIAKKVLDTKSSYLHSMLALNELLRLPNAGELFTGDLKDQARDLWLKLKSTGIQINDPPILFGLPKEFTPEDGKGS